MPRPTPTEIPVIAIDGPSGAGKGTVAVAVADHLGWRLLDSGALYRVVALVARREGLIGNQGLSSATVLCSPNWSRGWISRSPRAA